MPPRPVSVALFVLDVAADDLRDVGVFLLLRLDERVFGVVLDGLFRLPVIGRFCLFGCRRYLLALGLGVGFLSEISSASWTSSASTSGSRGRPADE